MNRKSFLKYLGFYTAAAMATQQLIAQVAPKADPEPSRKKKSPEYPTMVMHDRFYGDDMTVGAEGKTFKIAFSDGSFKKDNIIFPRYDPRCILWVENDGIYNKLTGSWDYDVKIASNIVRYIPRKFLLAAVIYQKISSTPMI